MNVPRRQSDLIAAAQNYRPGKWESRIDKLVGLVAPRAALRMMEARRKMHLFSYQTARSNDLRPNANSSSVSGETMRGNQERKNMMWNGIQLIEDSGLAFRIQQLFCDYVCGTLRYQARTGSARVNQLIEDYVKAKFSRSVDIAGKWSFRQYAINAIRGCVVKGDLGFNFVRNGELYLQGIEADRIGHPYDYRATKTFIGGVHLDQFGGYQAFDIYTRDRMSTQYYFEDQIPAYDQNGLPRFLLVVNPLTCDDVRGRSVFARTIDKIDWLNKIRDYELQAQEWAASQSGVYYTLDGAMPNGTAFDDGAQPETDQFGNVMRRFSIRANTITAMGSAERVEMLKNERPSENVQKMYRETVRDIAIGCGLSFGMVYDMSGVTGTAVRFYSSQDKRAIIGWREMLKETFLDIATPLFIGDAIARGELPFHPKWNCGAWIFPPHPTVDAGRDSNANVMERCAGLTSGAQIATEDGEDIEEITQQLGIEAQATIQLAMDIAKQLGLSDWREVADFIGNGRRTMQGVAFEAARSLQARGTAEQRAEAGGNPLDATSEGAEMQ